MLAEVSGTYSFSCVCNTIAIGILAMPTTRGGMACVNDSLCIRKFQSDVPDCNKEYTALASFFAHCFVCILVPDFVFYPSKKCCLTFSGSHLTTSVRWCQPASA